MAQEQGRLFLLPSPIAEGETGSISGEVISVLHRLDYFIVEKARTARRFISLTKPNRPIDVLHIAEMPENEISEAEIESSMSPLLKGHDVGILSEAGLPCIADPGNRYVAFA
ncbi:MAG TPA: hypothetical protein VJ508_15395, partial [Saprospiraceae bacterium]|nr:hypothetical protein [Saprospiraceae bacterium]